MQLVVMGVHSVLPSTYVAYVTLHPTMSLANSAILSATFITGAHCPLLSLVLLHLTLIWSPWLQSNFDQAPWTLGRCPAETGGYPGRLHPLCGTLHPRLATMNTSNDQPATAPILAKGVYTELQGHLLGFITRE